jgi:hypothetical protein
MRKYIIYAILGFTLLSGCISAPKAATPSQSQIDTQVAIILTRAATETVEPTLVPTLPPLTATPAPPQSTSTATAIPTTAPTATSTPVTPTQVPPTPTTPATDPKLSLGKPTWTDNFQTGKSFGMMDTDETKVEALNGHLYLTAKNANGFHGWTMSIREIQNFYLEATFKTGDCSGKDRYGLVFRSPTTFDKGYFFGVTCDGNFDFRRWDTDGFTVINDYSKSSSISTGSNQVNRLGVMAKGNNFTFYVNGNQVGSATDDTFTDSGTFGMFIASLNTENLTIEADEIAYWKLQ